MTTTELHARAHGRAYDERVHIFSVPGRAGVYITRSKSTPRKRYSLFAGQDGVACSCPGFQYRGCCKHAEALLNRLGRESGGVQPQQDPTAPTAVSQLAA